jgi:hypothetical protein
MAAPASAIFGRGDGPENSHPRPFASSEVEKRVLRCFNLARHERAIVQALLHSPARLPLRSWVVRSTGLPFTLLVMVLPSVSVSAV